MEASNKKVIVVVGAGVFGVSAANRLSKELNSSQYSIKLVAASDFIYFLVSAVRLTVSKDYSNTILSLNTYLEDAVEVVKDKCVSLTPKSICLASGLTLDFDVLILATGSKWSDPISSADVFGNNYKSYFENESGRIDAAKHIVFRGGGFVTCELVGELLEKYREAIHSGEKRISIIHNSDKLLPGGSFYSETLRDKVTKYIQSNNVSLYLNTVGTISDSDPNRIDMKGSAVDHLHADLIYNNVGISPSVPANNIQDLCDSRGFVRVEKTFQTKAKETPNVFAIGDITDFVYHGLLLRDNWVYTLVHNVTSYLNNTHSPSFVSAKTYETGHTMCAVSLGPNVGYGQIPLPLLGTFQVPSFVITRAKSRNLFSEKIESLFNN